MRILHLCLSNFFIDDRAYQENELVAEHVRQGHNVKIIASTNILNSGGFRDFCDPGEYFVKEGALITRLPYHPLIPKYLAKSLRVHRGLYKMIKEFKPDTILFHGTGGWEIVTTARYVKHHPDTLFYVDNHTDRLNSARNFVSKWVLHYLFYRICLHVALPQVKKVLNISFLTEEFAREIYRVPSEKMEFFPLGGRIPDDPEYNKRRVNTRAKFNFASEDIVFVQSGRQTRDKFLVEALTAFSAIKDARFRFVIAGIIKDEIRDEVFNLISKDKRIRYLGWMSADDLEDLLCASDVYVQPGKNSSTMQTSMCCRCALILEDIKGHDFYVHSNGWLIKTPSELGVIFSNISEDSSKLGVMAIRSYDFARENLDYTILAKRIFS